MLRASAAALAVIALLILAACARPVAGDVASSYGIGSPADPGTIARLEIDVSPDGTGLPPGAGTPERGAVIFASACARCHGTAVRLDPERWPYATTVFDYIRRAMPPNRLERLTDGDIYAVTAYILFANRDVGPTYGINASTLPLVTMPKIKAFFAAH